MAEYGQRIPAGFVHMADRVIEVFPVKYDGIDDCYVICSEQDGTHTCIRFGYAGVYTDMLVARGDDSNLDSLIDAVR